jgi:hypothetical protein
MKLSPRLILPFLIMSLLVGILGGWIRMGWGIEFSQSAGHHGIIMTSCFLGGLITLERTITMKPRWWLVFPASLGTSIVFFLSDILPVAYSLIVFGSVGLVALYIRQMLIHKEHYWYLLLAGSLFWLIGNLKLVQSGFVPASSGWWIGFVLFTILGERLELSRFVPVPKWAKSVLWLLLLLLAASFFIPFHGSGMLLSGSAISLITLWFLQFDIARKSVKKTGLFRYTGLSMIVGYGWLVSHALLVLASVGHPLFYDLYLHTFFLGFTFSMIWAHAPIILPAVLKQKVKIYYPVLWVFWLLFQLSLIGRVIATYTVDFSLRKFFGLANGLSMVLMLVAIVIVLLLRLRQQKRAA